VEDTDKPVPKQDSATQDVRQRQPQPEWKAAASGKLEPKRELIAVIPGLKHKHGRRFKQGKRKIVEELIFEAMACGECPNILAKDFRDLQDLKDFIRDNINLTQLTGKINVQIGDPRKKVDRATVRRALWKLWEANRNPRDPT
jgi:hypothetical protein